MEIKIRVKDCKLKGIMDFEDFQGNLKSLSKEAKEKLKASILRNGFNAPIFIWQTKIIDGHQRITALKELLKEGHTIQNGNYLPYVEIEADNEKQAAEMILSYNSQYGDITGLEEFTQKFELDLNELEEFTNLNLDMEELDPPTPSDILPPPLEETTNIKDGDIFLLDQKHYIMCGDSAKKEYIDVLFNKVQIDMIFTDPPYAVNYEKKTKEIFKDDSYTKIKNDDLPVKEIAEKIWRPCFKLMFDHATDTCSFYMTMPQGGDQMMMMMMMMMSENWQVKHELIWVKPNAVFSMNRLDYDYKHEPIMYGWKKRHNFYRKGKFTNSIWEVGRDTDKLHPTMKPIELISNAILNSTQEQDLVYDPFLGSGSTLIAADQLNRKCYGVEIDPLYVSVILRRYKKLKPTAEIKCLNRDFDLTGELNV